MRDNYPPVEHRILLHEGSDYTDGIHPYDPGGPTRWGITLEDARLHWKPNATADDVRTMPESVAMAIYKPHYWDALNGDALPSGVDDTVVDYGVNSGIGRAGKVLRRVLGLPDNTWHVDQSVLDALAQRNTIEVIHAINSERLRFLQTLAIWPTYKGGWTTRVREVDAFSVELASKPGVMPTTIKTAPSIVRPMAKGRIKPPTIPKNVTIAGTGSAAAGIAAISQWISLHSAAAMLGAAFIIVIGICVIRLLDRRHHAAQEAPTPGLIPVPVS